MKRRRNDKSKRFRASDVVARQKVYLIVDGYNLMHVTRFKPRSNDLGELRRCREGLLSLLAEHLPSSQYREVTIVFDSSHAPKHLPDCLNWQHLQVVFARSENTADDLIAKLVQGHAHAQNLVVISSDHRVQNAASRRRATVLDSDDWFDALLDHQLPRPAFESESQAELDEEQLSEFLAAMKEPKSDSEAKCEGRSSKEVEVNDNPFPEGYFDDLDELV